MTLARLLAFPARFAPLDLVQAILRVALAVPFWMSGRLKWDAPFRLSDTAVFLFSDEFKLHLPGGPYDYPLPHVMAFASGTAELVLPLLLVLGFATRWAAVGLLAMIAIIQLTIPDGWPLHLTWAAMALALVAGGAGRWSVDGVIAR